jgi:hypothetical protein
MYSLPSGSSSEMARGNDSLKGSGVIFGYFMQVAGIILNFQRTHWIFTTVKSDTPVFNLPYCKNVISDLLSNYVHQ